MSQFGSGDDSDVEKNRLAIEIIATLVNIKGSMADLILKPSGIESSIYTKFLYQIDETTGRSISKRRAAPLILREAENLGIADKAIRSIIEIASRWSSFHLAADEYQARATVQKAQAFLGVVERIEAEERRRQEKSRIDEKARIEREKADLLKKHCELLLLMFDAIAMDNNPQKRGYLLEEFMNRLFTLFDIYVVAGFRRNDNGEQIDGGFRLDGWHYLVECKWTKKLAGVQELDGIRGKVDRSGKQTMAFFVSIEGWSENVIPLLKQNTSKSVILMDGYDIRVVLQGKLDFKDFLMNKIAHLNFNAEPWLSVQSYQKSLKND